MGIAVGVVLTASGEPLMVRDRANPVISINPACAWRSIHIANAAVLSPEESPDGRWRLYIRGSGRFPEEDPDPARNYHDSIGLFTQEAETFSPRGPWVPYSGNPLLKHGPVGSYNDKHLLDCTPFHGMRNGKPALFMLYKGVSYKKGGCLAGAVSLDGGKRFEHFSANPLKTRCGPADAVFHQGRYYIFFGDTKYDPVLRKPTEKLKLYVAVVEDPEEFVSAESKLALDTGAPGDFDSESVHGGRIFRLNQRWYMVYQCSSKHMDYPDRFHVAWSDDLLEWHKVKSSRPFFTRGEAGAWDEGAIWYGEVFEHDNYLHMYYEGWGSGKAGGARNKPYFKGGRSQTGLASVSVNEFLKWCGHTNDRKM
ncbi:hypothetical protein P4B35_07765 [Pontiellaceae bacterium B12227]|nr:hypothetical protein [Pontiellaceae bacterium B12227]